MTRETARIIVEQLDNYLSHTCQDYGERDHEAMTIAIKALEQESQTFEWCKTCREYDQEKHCCHRWSKVIRNTVEEMKQEPYEDAIAVREFGLNDFIEFGKKAFGVELTFKKSDNPDTYEELFGTTKAESEVQDADSN